MQGCIYALIFCPMVRRLLDGAAWHLSWFTHLGLRLNGIDEARSAEMLCANAQGPVGGVSKGGGGFPDLD